MERFVKIIAFSVNHFRLSFIIDIWQGPKYDSDAFTRSPEVFWKKAVLKNSAK